MKLKELVQQAKESSPQLAGLPDAKAVALVREVFRQIGQQIEGAQEGMVKVAGLGNFRVKTVTREGESRKRVTFQQAKAGGKGAGADEGADD